MALSKEERLNKLHKLAEIEGYDTVDDMLEATTCDAVSPAICVADGCDYTVEMEPDQDQGWCDECEHRRRRARARGYYLMRPKVRDLNDAFRTTFRGGRVCMTSGIASLPDDIRNEILGKVRTFTEFTEDNDPHGEHDFGVVDIAGHKVFWEDRLLRRRYGRRLRRSSEPGRDDQGAHHLFRG